MNKYWKRFSGSLVRPKFDWRTCGEYSREFDGTWYLSCAPSSGPALVPANIGRRSINLERSLCRNFPSLGVLRIPEGRVLGSDGWVFGRENILLPELSWYGRNVTEIDLPKTSRVQKLKGSCLSIATNWMRSNYGHFLLDSLPRLWLVQRAGLNIDSFDHIYCPTDNMRRGIDWMSRLGIPAEKCIFEPLEEESSLQADVLFATSFPGLRRNYPSWTSKFLRDCISDHEFGDQGRRLYISRNGSSRNVSNEADVRSILDKYGFEFYNPGIGKNSIRDFSEASAVVGARGAGLADIAFCKPGAKIIELLPSDHIFPYYCSLSISAGHDYSYLVGRSDGSRWLRSGGPSPFDFEVDVERLDLALSSLVSS